MLRLTTRPVERCCQTVNITDIANDHHSAIFPRCCCQILRLPSNTTISDQCDCSQ
jgi:hypothetical protein